MKLEVKNGCFGYRRNERLLSGVEISCGTGEAAAVLGPNGAGKTTLLRCMLGFLTWSRGATLLDGKDIRKIDREVLWQKLGYVPQSKGTGLSIETEEMILLGRSKKGIFAVPGEADRKAVEVCMEQLGISSLRGRMCSRISGGELQLVLIARALVKHPEILVLDEPEAGLDFKNRLHILKLLEQLKKDGLQLIFNTHYPEDAYRLADKVLLLREGENRFGLAKEMLTERNLEWTFRVGIMINRIQRGGRETVCVLPYERERQEGN